MEQGISTFTPTVMVTWFLVAASLLALSVLAYTAARHHQRKVDPSLAMEAFRALDLEAFRNLVDPAEEAYLRDNLPPAKFRSIQRQRTWAALIYTWEAGSAAKALALVGQAARRSADPSIVASGVEITQTALQLRLRTIHAILSLAGELLVPGLKNTAVLALVEQCGRSTQRLLSLERFAVNVRVANPEGV